MAARGVEHLPVRLLRLPHSTDLLALVRAGAGWLFFRDSGHLHRANRHGFCYRLLPLGHGYPPRRAGSCFSNSLLLVAVEDTAIIIEPELDLHRRAHHRILVGDRHHLSHGFRLFEQEPMLEHRAVLDSIDEVLDRQYLGNVLAPVPEFRPALDVGVVRLIRPLGAEGQESCRGRTNVGAGEVAHDASLKSSHELMLFG
jgi:hypothetical protein